MADISETDEEYLIKAELPEVKKEDVKVDVLDGVLTIEGERTQEKEEKGKKFHKVERSYGKFVRQFALPAEVDAPKIQAEFKDGMTVGTVAEKTRLTLSERSEPGCKRLLEYQVAGESEAHAIPLTQ